MYAVMFDYVPVPTKARVEFYVDSILCSDLGCEKVGEGFYKVNSSPLDCMAAVGRLKEVPNFQQNIRNLTVVSMDTWLK